MRQIYIIMLINILCCINVFNGFAQSFKYVKYPYAMSFGLNEIYISSITFSSHETRIDFITHYTGEYIYLRNSMHIKAGNHKFNLRYTVGIETECATICKQDQTLEFSAHFDPVPDEYRNKIDLKEGFSDTLDFYEISIDKHLSQSQVSYWLFSMDEDFWNKIYNYEIKHRFERQIRATNLVLKEMEENKRSNTKQKKAVKRNILKKDPNFKIE